jgi:MATE family multidrug resistance protein
MSTIRAEIRPLLLLALPITAGQAGQMMMSITDSIMIGQVGTVPLAASALVTAIVHILMIPGLGLISPVSVKVAQSVGSGERSAIGQYLRHGIFLGAASGTLFAVILCLCLPLLNLLGQPPEVVREAGAYYVLIAVSIIPILIFHAQKQYCEGLHKAAAPMWILLGGILLNVVLNWVLIYGNLGAPVLGLAGAGYATLISRWVIVFGLWAWIAKREPFRSDMPASWWTPLESAKVRILLGMGIPVAFQYSFEVTAFSVAGLFMGALGAIPLAAHQIALSLAGFTFMFPLGISIAASVRVGQAHGASELDRLRAIGRAGHVCSVCIMGTTALSFILFGEWFALGFTSPDDPAAAAVVALASTLLIIAGIFQLFDGTQVVSVGALRGLNDVKIPTLMIFCAYWLFTIPLAWALAFPLELGANGVWIGLACGLAVSATLLTSRFEQLARQHAK